ncbi:MAG: M14 family metallopeptidase [Balneolaceae bacterium]|nr:M14 family metallopeptidase [Balneolaceae bacterium]
MRIQLKSSLLALVAFLFLSINVSAQTDLQSPEQYLGYELGEHWTPHYKVIGYFKHVAEASPMVAYQQYGTTNEGRELVYVTVSTEENMDRIEEIRTNNLKRTGLVEGEPTENSTAIVWLSYNVHGDETSSSEAAMKTIYELVNPSNSESKQWLQNTMVIMDPMLNPDGRDRYVHWYKETAGDEPNPHLDAREQNQPWPQGRTNHYYFDLNRDWAWLTQKESRQRNEVYQQWLPHIHVDFHEQGHNSPYYFAPAAEPFHKAITEWQREFQYTIGQNHAEYFDRNNWLYFTREIFDLFYPSYGDTYPIFNGAIGMTYEQAGQKGLEVLQTGGDTLTLKDRLTHHHITGMSTVEVVSQHANRVVSEFASYYQDAMENPAGEYKAFVIEGDNDPDKLRRMFDLLDKHHIAYGKAPRNRTYKGYNYATGQNERVEVTTNDYVVSVYQPKSVLARIFFEPNPELSDSLTYDITAWGQHYAMGLDGYALTDRINPVSASAPQVVVDNSSSGSPYAYLAEWKTMTDMQMLSGLLNKEVKTRIASEQFTIQGRTYEPGTLIITRNDNKHLGSKFDEVVQETATSFNQQVHAVPTGFVESGPDFGSGAVEYMEKPRVALLSGDGTSSYNVGEIWHFFDKQIDYPVTLVDMEDFTMGIKLSQYDVLILPDGYYGSRMSDEKIEQIKDWVSSGGVL